MSALKKFTSVGATLVLITAGVIGASTAASAHTPSVSSTCEALSVNLTNYQTGTPDSITTVTDTAAYDETVPATYKTVHHDAVTHTVHHDAVTAQGHWWNWSPNKDQGPFDGPPSFPADDRGTWHEHDNGGPGDGTEGTFGGNGNGDWFHRGPVVIVTPASDEVITDHIAYDETVVDVAEHVVHHDAVTHQVTVPGTTNVVSVLIDGATIVDHQSFGTSYVQSFNYDDKYVAHTYKVIVRAWDDPNGSKGWSKNFNGTSTPCQRPDNLITYSYNVPPVTCDNRVSDPTLTYEHATGNFEAGEHPNTPGGTYTVTLTADEGYTFEGGKTVTFDVVVPNALTDEDCTVAPTLVIPGTPVIKDLCGITQDHYGLLADTENIAYSRDGKAIIATLHGDNVAWGTLPSGWAKTSDTVATYAFDDELFTNVPCVVPVPAVFDFPTTSPECDADATFDDGFFPYQGNGFVLTVDRPYDGPGDYTLTATADAGFTFEGEGDPFVRTSVVTLDGAFGFQSEDAEAPCFLAPPIEVTLGTPVLNDVCGTANDFGDKPEDTEGVSYVWDSEDETNFDIDAVIADGYVVNDLPAGWTATEDSSVFFYAWAPTFTDVACPTTATPTPGTTPTPVVNVVVPPTARPALASTGLNAFQQGGIAALVLALGVGGVLIGSRRRKVTI
jgi:hypothetical protein